MPNIYTVYTDASPLGIATWVIISDGNTAKAHERIEVRSQNEGEAKAILLAVSSLPASAIVNLYSDSQLIVFGLTGRNNIKAPHLDYLIREIRRVVNEKGLFIQFHWVKDTKNEAGIYLEQIKQTKGRSQW
jgi:ribonuclease HI